jgi:tRNA pseudouridine55 synthase
MDFKKIPLVFNVRKPVGVSSFDVVHHYKKNLGFKFGKIGHFGTLDPFAEGVLLIGIQGAQKLNDYVHQLLPKTYQARGVFGGKTQSGDLTSEVIETKHIDQKWINATQSEILDFLSEQFLGEYWQRPHAISATKFEGKRLYQHALEGRLIEKEKVKREIYSLEILDYQYPYLDFLVTVSSGTYVRSLFEEISTLMNGYGALMTLERKAVGTLSLDQSLNYENWPQLGKPFSLESHGMPLDRVLELDAVYLLLPQTMRYVQGHRFKLSEVEIRKNPKPICSENYFWVYNEDGTLLGFGRPNGPELHAIFNLQLSISLFS